VDEGTLSNLISAYQSGRMEEAADLCREILSREPDQPEATYLLGRIHLDRSDSALAVPLLRRAVKLAPDWPEVQANLGAALFLRGKMEEAAYHIRQAAALDPEDAEAQNNLGVVLQAGGRAGEAEAAFLRALELRPDYPEALRNLGSTLQAVGRHSEAMERLRSALALDPNSADVSLALGKACLATGDLDAAEGAFERALRIAPASAQALQGMAELQASRLRAGSASECVRMGMESLERGDAGSAEAAFRQALAVSPEHAGALKGLADVHLRTQRPDQARRVLEHLLEISGESADLVTDHAIALRQLGERQESAARLRRAIEIDPGHARAIAGLACLLAELDESDESVPLCRRGLALRPNDPHLLHALGVGLARQKDDEAAAEAFQAALRIDPRLPGARSNLGALWHRRGNVMRAARDLRRALRIDPNNADALNNLAACYLSRRRYEAGEEMLRQAIALAPHATGARANLATCLLAQGKYEEGWSEYEHRIKTSECWIFETKAPRWRGEPNPAGTLMVCCEQGYGDNVQFVRYLAMAKSRWMGEVVFTAYPVQIPLFEASELPIRIVPWSPHADGPHPDFDAVISLMSLPGLFRTNSETIPSRVPYLRAPGERLSAWSERIDASSALKIGLVWAGTPSPMVRQRACDLYQLAPLAGIPGTRFYSLQLGESAKQLQDPPEGLGIVDLGKHIVDFADTAAAMQHLDLVISIDSAPAHLAGALGRPVWTLLPFYADWRWLIDREDSPWYPTMRLFRQPRPNAWEPVWNRVAEELRRFVRAGRPPRA
jgi:Flp pilus assembly protein TadD